MVWQPSAMVPEGVSEKREVKVSGNSVQAVAQWPWAATAGSQDCRKAGRWDRVYFGQKEAVSRLWHSA